MVKAKKQTAEATDNHEKDVFDEQIAARAEEMQNRPEDMAIKTGEIIHSVAESTRLPYEPPSHVSQQTPTTRTPIERKKYTPLPDPMGFESIKGSGENRVRLLKSEGEGAWVIRFAHNPNEDKGLNGETYSKENQHPVIPMLKSEGYRWGFDGGDGKGGWGKRFTGDAYGADHIEARRVLQSAAEMIGAPNQEQGRGAD